MKLLITGFSPFGGESVNPSYETARGLPDRIGPFDLIKAEIPTSFSRSFAVLRPLIQTHKPDAVMLLGQAGGRTAITPERVAINVMDASRPDNDGESPKDVPIDPLGPAAYFSTLPIKEMEKAMLSAGIPAAISNTAGTYVCNYLMYQALHFLQKEGVCVPCGFIHVPFIPEQVKDKDAFSLPLPQLIAGIQAAISAL